MIMTKRLWKGKRMEPVPYHRCLAFSEHISGKLCIFCTTTGRREAGVSSSFPNQRANLTGHQSPWAQEYVRV